MIAGRPQPVAQIAEFAYDIFGFHFVSPEIIPGVTPAGRTVGGRPIHIEFGAAPRSIRRPEYEDESVQATGAEYLLHYPDLARIYFRLCESGGDQMVVERSPGADPAALWPMILAVGASISGFRRGCVPLHASAVIHGDDCMAFAGQSTAGKSTLAALLSRQGFVLHADDLCLAQGANQSVAVGPGVPELRLGEDAARMAGWSDIAPAAVFPESGKSAFPWPPAERISRCLRRIYVLEFASESAPAGIYPLGGVEALQALIGCLRIRLPLLFTGLVSENFERLAALSRAVDMFRFVRPFDPEQSGYWAERLAEHFDAV